MMKKCLIVGGSGYLGRHLAQQLVHEGCEVRIFSHVNHHDLDPRIEVLEGDIRNTEHVNQVCQGGIDVVFHVASLIYLFGVASQETRQLVYDVNVLGTKNVIDGCIANGIPLLIYTSSNNVVLDHAIHGGDESLPYAKHFVDIYSETKAKADHLILETNGKSGLRTCVLRPGGIYGPGEQIMLPRLMEVIRKNKLHVIIGDGHALVDSVYIDNVVDAHILAAKSLKDNSQVVAGQAYFISDDEPMTYLSFFKPIFQKFSYPIPTRKLPFWLIYSFAYFSEILFFLFRIPPFLTRIEVMKIGMTHYFKIDKAKKELGYYPRVSTKEGLLACLPYCEYVYNNTEHVQRPYIAWWIAIITGMSVLTVLSFNAHLFYLFSHYIFGLFSQFELQILLFLAIVVHICEALYAKKIALSLGFVSTSFSWFLQTLLLGYPSLRLLLRCKRKYDRNRQL